MERDKRWERTKKAYDAIVKGVGVNAASAEEAIKAAYVKDQTDEFIEPSVISGGTKVQDNDSVIFFNFRIDRPRQVTMEFVVGDFEKLNLSWEFDPYAVKYEAKEQGKAEILKREPFSGRVVLKNIYFVTMTQYQKNLHVSEVAFPPLEIQDNL